MEEGGAGGSDGTRPASRLSDVRCGACSNPQPGSISTAADAVSAQTPHMTATALWGSVPLGCLGLHSHNGDHLARLQWPGQWHHLQPLSMRSEQGF